MTETTLQAVRRQIAECQAKVDSVEPGDTSKQTLARLIAFEARYLEQFNEDGTAKDPSKAYG